MTASSVLITGGCGLLGRHVTAAIGAGYKTGVLDIAPRADEDGAYHQVDVLDPDAVARSMRGYDVVVHLAGLDAAVDATEAAFYNVNVQGTWNVLQAAAANAVSRVVLCSSVAAVGLSPAQPPLYLPVDAHHPCRPVSAYGLSKRLMELTGAMFARRGSFEVFCLRPALVAQPDQVYDIAVRTAAEDGVSPPPPAAHPGWRQLFEPLTPTRSFISPGDAAACFAAAVAAPALPPPSPGEKGFGTWFVAAPETFTSLPTRELLRRGFGVTHEWHDRAPDPPASRRAVFEVASTQQQFGWAPGENWEQLLAGTLAEAGVDITAR